MVVVWLAGLAAGAAHALSGPDHLVAVAPLAVDRPGGAWRIGLRWGAGHASAVAGLGTLAIALRGRLDLDRWAPAGELCVGLGLVALGVWGWRRAVSRFVHAHEHEHDGVRHRHLHVHARSIVHPHPHAHRHRHLAFGFGVLHGVSSTSHILGVLPALALPALPVAAAYLASFALGTLAAMAAYSSLVGSVARSAAAGVRVYRWILGAAASASLATGIAWILISAAALRSLAGSAG